MANRAFRLSVFLCCVIAQTVFPVSGSTFEQQVGIYINGEYQALMTKYSNDSCKENCCCMIFSPNTYIQNNLMKYGWRFDRVDICFYSTWPNTNFNFPYVDPPYQIGTTSGDRMPFANFNGVPSYFSSPPGFKDEMCYNSDFINNGYEDIIESLVVLYNPAYNKIIITLENSGHLEGYVGGVLEPLSIPADSSIPVNSPEHEKYVESALKNGGFEGWNVIPTCKNCIFYFGKNGEPVYLGTIDDDDTRNRNSSSFNRNPSIDVGGD